jgi:hypothetical protein
MNKIILFLFLISCGFAEEGHWVYEDGWVFKKEDASGGGAVIQNKATDTTITRQNDTLIKETFKNKESNDLLKGWTATRNGINTPTLFVIPILCSPSKSQCTK